MLNSLVIKNFRCLEDFEVSKLGRVNLIVGKNNSGKSSVLEALRIYAGNANLNLLIDIAQSHDEKYQSEIFDDINTSKPFEDFFTGRNFPVDETPIVIGNSLEDTYKLQIIHGFYIDKARESFIKKTINNNSDELEENYDFTPKEREILFIKKGKIGFPINLHYASSSLGMDIFLKEYGAVPCSVIPTKFISIDELANEWDKIVFTRHEEIVKQSLRIVLPNFENLAFISKQSKRSAKVKLSDQPRPIPLKSLGDGMLRVLQLAIKLVSAQGGFLLIDEFENGLHYSIQEKIWGLLFEMAEKLDIQVFATTHSWDCIESFAKVANDKPDIEGVLFRMGKSARKSNQGQIIATVFDKTELYNITQADVEIR